MELQVDTLESSKQPHGRIWTQKLKYDLGRMPQYFWISNNVEIMAFRIGEEVFVYSSICPHMGAQLQCRRRSKVLTCPWHPLVFNIKTAQSNHHKYKTIRRYKADYKNGELRVFF